MKRNKGKNLLTFPDNFCLVDVETTGLDPQYDEIIEIGAIRVRSGEMRDRFRMLVKPSEPISEFIEQLTGITNDMLAEALPLKSVLQVFRTFLGDDIIVGHNINFDINFLYDGCIALNLPEISNDFVDTMRIARFVIPELEHHRLKDLCKHYQVENLNAHRAIYDCEATFELLKQLRKTFAEKCLEWPARSKSKSKDLHAQTDAFDVTHPLYGKQCVFTGALSRMTRAEAMQIVLNLGGTNGDNLSKKTDFLVVGSTEYSANVKGGKTGKMKKAEDYILKGCDITILSESAFYDMIAE